MSKFKVVVCKKPKHNKLRYIANEKLQPQSPLSDGEVFVIGKPKYVGKFVQRRDIEVLPADEFRHFSHPGVQQLNELIRRGTDDTSPR